MRRRLVALLLFVLAACERRTTPDEPPEPPSPPSPAFRNVSAPTAYVGDSTCASCHARETEAYRSHAMARSFHRWTPETRVEPTLAAPLRHAPTGLSYAIVEEEGRLQQVEFLEGPGGRRLHELRRPIDYVMGSGAIARTYFTEENGRLFQLPLTWYRSHGWDFSPGYEIDNARFGRLMPDRCIACHASYPAPIAHLEGKYAAVRPGIGCERCHGPGALHATERAATRDSGGAFDNTIVNPARLPLERRLDVCEQCHVHTSVNVLREGKETFGYVPSQPLRDQWAFFKTGGIDVVSHADRLRQSACFVATRRSARPLECATCHDPHAPTPTAETRSAPCQRCHESAALQRRVASAARADHAPRADCVRCHMPAVRERTVPHGTFTEHWIRATPGDAPAPNGVRPGMLEPYYARDREGPEARVYQGMGSVVRATLAGDGRALREGADALREAIGDDTTRPSALFLLGVVSDQLGRTDDAIRALERSARAAPDRPETLRALARAYERANRPPAEVERLYERALAAQPALAWIRADYADFLQAHDRRDDAERAYRAALAEQPSLAVAWFNLGTVLAAGDRRDAAAAAFGEALRLEPVFGQALASLLDVRVAPGRGPEGGGAVVSVTRAASPLPSLLVRERGPGALHVSAEGAGVRFVNVPTRGFVQVLRPDGSAVRTLPTADAATLTWDLRGDDGRPIGGGLYRVRAQGRDASGARRPPQFLSFAVVRRVAP